VATITSPLRVHRKATRQDTRTQNRRLVLQQVFNDSNTTRADIARATGLTPATVSHLIAELLDEGLVIETGTGSSAGGKPPTLLDLNAGAQSLISIDLSDGTLTGSILDLRGTKTHLTAPPLAFGRGDIAVQQLFDAIDTLFAATSTPVLGLGIGTPGVVESDGTVIEASNLGWRNIPLGRLLSDRYDVPVSVLNNSRAAALAEYSFGGHDAENLVVVKIGNGIGAGIVIDGRIHRGEDSAAGEIGHVVVDPDGPECFCGKFGCLETVAAIPSLMRTLGSRLPDTNSTPSELLKRAAEEAGSGNTFVQTVLDDTGRNLAKVLSTTVAILDIHKVVITGLIAALGQPFLAHLHGEIGQRVLPALAGKLELTYGTTGGRAVRLGAAASVLNAQLGVL